MLVLTMEQDGPPFWIGEAKITIIRVRGRHVRIGIDAPRDVPIDRDAIRKSKLKNREIP